jgi:excinuclease ABC subunit A
VPRLRGHGRALTREQRKAFDDSVRDDDNKGREQTFAEPEVEDVTDSACPTCHGTRLNAGPRRAVCGHRHHRHCIALSVRDVHPPVGGGPATEGADSGRETGIARDLVPEIKGRLEFLEEVGLGYLTLDRGAPTLSGGEAQRIRLAAQLGSNLQGVCYVLDEPTIGLHARDNQILLNALPSWATRATPWWWWSTTKTPSAGPTTSSTSAPAPASAVGGWWRRARWPTVGVPIP